MREEEKDKYYSSKLLLDIARNEYQNDLGTIDSLYTRVGITLAFVVIFLGWQLNNASNVFSLDLSKYKQFLYFLKLMSLLFYSIACLLGITSILLFLYVIAVGKLERISRIGFTQEVAKTEESLQAWYLTDIYIKCLEKKRKNIKKEVTDLQFRNKIDNGAYYFILSLFNYRINLKVVVYN